MTGTEELQKLAPTVRLADGGSRVSRAHETVDSPDTRRGFATAHVLDWHVQMDDRTIRAEARRRRVTIAKRRLGERDDDVIDGPDAVSLVYQLTLASWALAGKPFPKVARSELPIRFVSGRRD